MALNKQFATLYGVTSYEVTADYNKVEHVSAVGIEVGLYSSQQARDAGCPSIEKFHYYDVPSSYFDESVLKNDGVSMKTQAYTYLKTLEVYSGATDV